MFKRILQAISTFFYDPRVNEQLAELDARLTSIEDERYRARKLNQFMDLMLLHGPESIQTAQWLRNHSHDPILVEQAKRDQDIFVGKGIGKSPIPLTGHNHPKGLN